MQIDMMFWEYMFWEFNLYLYGVITATKISARSFHFWKSWEHYLVMRVLPVSSLKNKNWLSWYWCACCVWKIASSDAWVCLHNFYPDVGSAYELPVNKRFICTLHCMVMNQECWPLSLRISIVPGVLSEFFASPDDLKACTDSFHLHFSYSTSDSSCR